PQSEIVLAPAPVQQPETGLPALRRSRFAGLRLKASRPVEGSVPAAPEPPPQTIPARIPTEREQERARLKVLMAPYAPAFEAALKRKLALTALSHQETAQGVVGQAREAEPEPVRGTGTTQGRQALEIVAAELRRDRLALEERGLNTVRAWGTLEQAYEAAGKQYEWDEQREVGTRLEAFAQALKRDPELNSLLRELGRKLGIEAGSRLDQVVQAPEVDWRLLRSIDIEHGLRPRSGPGMGM
ncbi:MAG: hypothetical protein ACRYG8_09375, partial [Janthinobacterium lividum]